MANQVLLQEYSNSVKRLRLQCLDSGMSDEDFRKMYLESLDSLHTREPSETSNYRRALHKPLLLLIGSLCLLSVMYNYKTVYSCLMCKFQDFVYPGLRLLRKISVPLISLFPSLTEFYHESCLIQNPFFSVVDMDCWPCSGVTSVREVYDPKPVVQHQHTAPFVYDTEQKPITLDELKKIYRQNKEVFSKESPKILVNNKYYISTDEMFQEDKEKSNDYYIWRFNNMNVARLLRQIIQRPTVVPKFGQTTERFIVIDTSQKSFKIPDTECNFSFLLSLSGIRVVDLIPAEECKFQCKTLRVELPETYLLWYNWWYWRPVIQSSNGNSTFIGHVGSYC